jgi:hypothetical protein
MSTPLPFREFLAATAAATYDDYAERPNVKMRSVEAFARMQRYVLDHYAGKAAVKSVFVGRQIFDCLVTQAPRLDAILDDGDGCPQGSIPVRRITLEELTRFRTLREFLGKAPK